MFICSSVHKSVSWVIFASFADKCSCVFVFSLLFPAVEVCVRICECLQSILVSKVRRYLSWMDSVLLYECLSLSVAG